VHLEFEKLKEFKFVSEFPPEILKGLGVLAILNDVETPLSSDTVGQIQQGAINLKFRTVVLAALDFGPSPDKCLLETQFGKLLRQ
jgi:hypothetical protein